jgi:hypothetical protein
MVGWKRGKVSSSLGRCERRRRTHKEESDTLDGNVVEEEDEGGDKSCRVRDSVLDRLPVESVDNVGSSNVLRLDADLSERLLLGGEPAGRSGAVGEEEQSADTLRTRKGSVRARGRVW